MASIADRDSSIARRFLAELEAKRKVDAEGRVSFDGPGFDSAVGVVQDLLDLNADVPRSEHRRIAHQAVFAAARGGTVDLDSFVKASARLEHEYLARPIQRFVVVSEVAISDRDSLAGMRSGGVAISFPDRLPRAFLTARAPVIERASGDLHAPPPTDYRWARTSIRDRCAVGAAEHGLRHLQLLVGLWNLSLNRRSGVRRSYGGPRKPVNKIGIGPLHTIHDPSGRIPTETWWYEPDYYAPFKVKRIGVAADDMQLFATEARARLRTHPYGRDLAGWIRLYNASLDEPDWSASFVRLWQTLEALTGTGRQGYDVTVRRASFIYRDRPYSAALLNHLRDYRNRLVHSSQDSEADEVKLYTLKRYVENMLVFHLYDGPLYTRLSDVIELLDLPSSKDELERKKLLLGRAIRMHVRTPT